MSLKNIRAAKMMLTQKIAELTKLWSLSKIEPVENMTFNYVAKAKKYNELPVVLKISCDESAWIHEKKALDYFNHQGSIAILAHHQEYHALLLEQAMPGISLKSLYPLQEEYVMDCYVEVMQKLHCNHLPYPKDFPHIQDWLKSIDQATALPNHLIQKAISLKNDLIKSSTKDIFLHGDLHHDNVLQHSEAWLAIDPKGVIGEAEFELAAFDFLTVDEINQVANIASIFKERLGKLAQKSHFDSNRLYHWVFVRLVLKAAWQVEDQQDPSETLKLIERLFY